MYGIIHNIYIYMYELNSLQTGSMCSSFVYDVEVKRDGGRCADMYLINDVLL